MGDQYGIKNLSTGETRLETCRYRDTTNLGPKEEHDESVKVLHGERLSFYCVSIPGESPWVKDAFSKKYPVPCTPSTSDFAGRPKQRRRKIWMNVLLKPSKTRWKLVKIKWIPHHSLQNKRNQSPLKKNHQNLPR